MGDHFLSPCSCVKCIKHAIPLQWSPPTLPTTMQCSPLTQFIEETLRYAQTPQTCVYSLKLEVYPELPPNVFSDLEKKPRKLRARGSECQLTAGKSYCQSAVASENNLAVSLRISVRSKRRGWPIRMGDVLTSNHWSMVGWVRERHVPPTQEKERNSWQREKPGGYL